MLNQIITVLKKETLSFTLTLITEVSSLKEDKSCTDLNHSLFIIAKQQPDGQLVLDIKICQANEYMYVTHNYTFIWQNASH